MREKCICMIRIRCSTIPSTVYWWFFGGRKIKNVPATACGKLLCQHDGIRHHWQLQRASLSIEARLPVEMIICSICLLCTQATRHSATELQFVRFRLATSIQRRSQTSDCDFALKSNSQRHEFNVDRTRSEPANGRLVRLVPLGLRRLREFFFADATPRARNRVASHRNTRVPSRTAFLALERPVCVGSGPRKRSIDSGAQACSLEIGSDSLLPELIGEQPPRSHRYRAVIRPVHDYLWS